MLRTGSARAEKFEGVSIYCCEGRPLERFRFHFFIVAIFDILRVTACIADNVVVMAMYEFVMRTAAAHVGTREDFGACKRLKRTIYVYFVKIFAQTRGNFRDRRRLIRRFKEAKQCQPSLCGTKSLVAEHCLQFLTIFTSIPLHYLMLPLTQVSCNYKKGCYYPDMSPIIASVLAAVSIMLVSLVGVIFTYRSLGSWMRKHLTYLATFSAGVLSLLAYHLIEESLHEAPTAALAAGSILAGVIVMEIIHHLLPHAHHHHDVSTDHTHSQIDGRKVLISDAVHNITDGFIIVPAFFVDWTIGLAATLGILVHELVQEISEFFVLKEAGYSTRQALRLNFVASSTILLGVILSLVLASFETTLSLLAGFAAGGFLSVVVRDLLPNAAQSIRSSGTWLPHVAAGLIGAIIMLGVLTLVPHEEHEEDEGATATQAVEAL